MSEFVYALTLDPEQAKRALQDFAGEAKKSATEINSSLEIVQKAWSLVAGGVGFVVDKVGGWTAAAADSEVTQRRLNAAIGQGYAALADYNAALAAKLGIDDDDIAAAQTKLLGLGLQRSALEYATKASLGLAAATGKDLSAATKQVAKAFAEGGAEAKRMIDLYAIAEAQADTFTGRTNALATAWGELDEVLGAGVQSSQAANDLLVSMRSAVVDFTSYLDSEDGREVVDSFFRGIASGVGAAINALIGMSRVARDMQRDFAQIVDDMGGMTAEVGKAIGSTDLQRLGLEAQMAAIRDKMAIDAAGDPSWWSTAGDYADQLTKIGATKGGASDGANAGAGAAGARAGKEKKGGKKKVDTYGVDDDTLPNRQTILDYEAEVAAAAAERVAEGERLALDAQIEANELRFQAELAGFEERQKLKDEQLRAEEEFYGQLTSLGVQGIGGFISSTLQQWISGEASLGDAAASAFGAMLAQIGQGLVALGSSAVAAGLLGSVAPIFAAATGGPAGVAAGFGLIAAGGVLMGLGGLVQSGVGGGASAAAASTPATFTGASAEPRGFDSARADERQAAATVINIDMGRGFMTGTPREVGRQLWDLIQQAQTLRAQRAGS